VAVVLTVVPTKQIRIKIHKWNDTKTQYKQYTVNTGTLSPTQLLTHSNTNFLRKK